MRIIYAIIYLLISDAVDINFEFAQCDRHFVVVCGLKIFFLFIYLLISSGDIILIMSHLNLDYEYRGFSDPLSLIKFYLYLYYLDYSYI